MKVHAAVARALAGRVYSGASDKNDLEEIAARGYRLAFGREPKPDEQARAVAFLRKQPEHLSGCTDTLPMPMPMPSDGLCVPLVTIPTFALPTQIG